MSLTQREIDDMEVSLDGLNERMRAIAQYLNLDKDDIGDLEVSKYDEKIITYGHAKEEYLVLTPPESLDAVDENLENYIDDCILPEIPEDFRFYFDREKWKQAAETDGAGHILATYDGLEHAEDVNLTTYYIYRTN